MRVIVENWQREDEAGVFVFMLVVTASQRLCEYANVPKQLLVEEWHFLDCGTR